MLLSVGTALLSLLAIGAAPALGQQTHPFLGAVGTGELIEPSAVAVDDSTGDVYVSDPVFGLIHKYDSSGAPVSFSGTGSSVLSVTTNSIAVDNSGGVNQGHLYAMLPSGAIEAFTADGEPANFTESAGYIEGNRLNESAFPGGIGVDANGDIYGFEQELDVYAPSGRLILAATVPGSIAGASLAVDPSGHVYFLANGSGINPGGLLESAPSTFPVTPTTSFTPATPPTEAVISGVAADPVSGDLYTNDGKQITQYGPSGAGHPVIVTFGAEQLSAGSKSLAIDRSGTSSTGDIYAPAGDHVDRFGPLVTVPDATTDEAEPARVGDTATMTGEVNPDGIAVTACTFEYGTSTAYGETAPCAESPSEIGGGGSPVAVHADVAGLTAGNFHFRLVASNANGRGIGADQVLVVSGPPSISAESARATQHEAEVTATIDPGNAPTTYRIEYGPTSGYGKTREGRSVTGASPVPVLSHLFGLDPGTTYHYRVVAENTVGTVRGPDRTITTTTFAGGEDCPNERFRTGPSAHLPECRAYEMVTPPDKNGGNVAFAESPQVALSGNRVLFTSSVAFAGAQANPLQGAYLAERGSGSWETTAVEPPTTRTGQQTVTFAPTSGASAELSELLQTSVVGPGAGPNESRLYLYSAESKTRASIASHSGPALANEMVHTAASNQFVGGTPDFSTVLFQANTALAPGATEGVPNVYSYSGGRLSLVSELPIGEQGPAGASALPDRSYTPSAWRALSDDGSRAFFTEIVGNESGGLYMREGGAEPVPISLSQRAGADNRVRSVSFVTTTASGRFAFFVGKEPGEPLTNDADHANADLYRYDVDTGELDDLSAEDDASSEDLGVTGVNAVSEDGSFVYFSSTGGIGGAEPVPRGPFGYEGVNLYVWHDGVVRLLGREAGGAFGPFEAMASPDGREFAWVSATQITPESKESPNCAGSGGFCKQVYAYEYDGARVVCVTCDGSDDSDSSLGGGYLGVLQAAFSNKAAQAVLNNGMVFVNTANPLASGDVNGQQDVYSWQEGRVRLISTGLSNEPSNFAGISSDGKDVFLRTTQPLVGIDSGNDVDIYDARVGGGLDSQVAPESSGQCSAESCRAQVESAPTAPKLGSLLPGNVCTGDVSRATRLENKARAADRSAKKVRGRHSRQLRAKAKNDRRKAKRMRATARNCGGTH